MNNEQKVQDFHVSQHNSNEMLPAVSYEDEEGRTFNILSKKEPPLGKMILIHTFEDEVIEAKAYKSFPAIDFKTDFGIIESYEVKGWSFWQ